MTTAHRKKRHVKRPPKPKGKRHVGRPTIYSDELSERICQRLAAGESIRSISRDQKMPGLTTMMGWIFDGEHELFAKQYAKAREQRAEMYADRVLEEAQKPAKNSVDVQRRRLFIDTIKWVACKLRPKTYGDRQVLEHQGADGGPIKLVQELSDQELENLIRKREAGKTETAEEGKG